MHRREIVAFAHRRIGQIAKIFGFAIAEIRELSPDELDYWIQRANELSEDGYR